MHAGYLQDIFNPCARRDTLKDSCRIIRKQFKNQYNGILVSGGISGMFGLLLAEKLDTKLVVVRKETTPTHSTFMVENAGPSDKLLFVDDLYDTGGTFRYCYRTFKSECEHRYGFNGSEIIGAYFYQTDSVYSRDDMEAKFSVGEKYE